MTQFTGVVCRLRVETQEEEGAFVARSPELRMSNHGATPEEAKANLALSLRMFFDICAEKGTLFKVLRERGVQHAEIPPNEQDRVLEVPIPVMALENARRTVG